MKINVDISKLEPGVIDAPDGPTIAPLGMRSEGALLSIAISLKRIADALDGQHISGGLENIMHQAGVAFQNGVNSVQYRR